MSSDPVDKIIENSAKGATKGFLEWSSEKIKSLVIGLKDKKLAFIQEEETIKLVKKQYNSGELFFYKTYIEDKDLLLLLKLGLTLRELENGDKERKQNLRRKILDKYDVKGLHISQFVENGLLNRYIGILIDNLTDLDRFKNRIIETLTNIERYVLFVKMDDDERGVI